MPSKEASCHEEEEGEQGKTTSAVGVLLGKKRRGRDRVEGVVKWRVNVGPGIVHGYGGKACSLDLDLVNFIIVGPFTLKRGPLVVGGSNKRKGLLG